MELQISTGSSERKGPRSLLNMCLEIAIRNIQHISSFGDMPTHLLQPVLRAVKTAQHLHTIEQETDERIYEISPAHWKHLIQRDFKTLDAQYGWEPKDPRSWYKVYMKYETMHNQQIEEATNAFMKKMEDVNGQRSSRQAKIISVPESRRLPLHYSQRQREGPKAGHWSSQPRPKKTFIAKAKRQVAAETNRLKLSSPASRMPVRQSQITQAPVAMLNDARIGRQFDAASTIINAPIRKASEVTKASDRERKEREKRLLSIKGNGTAKPANVISFSDDEDDNLPSNGSDDLFGDDEPDSPPKRGSLSVEELEAVVDRIVSPHKRPIARPRGLLSAAPGANNRPTMAYSPPKSSAGSTSPLLVPTDKTSSTALSTSSSPASNAGGPAAPLVRKRKPVDIFMRPTKRGPR
ncbi:hypothetical protein QBC36DRAFT_329968 [Triangularia setosa]|uniref:Elongin-A n=1 Tax=Triangularia setosa TaxID=2587417 RepID=A0AAN7A6P0_9PEZI|nr:hypothetical protein QBC36DRAFT_329968 [Podospora setosa]